MIPEFLKGLIRYALPRSLRNWLRSPSKSVDWLWDNLKFSVGIKKALHLAPDIALYLHPHAFKFAYEYQITDPGQTAEFENFIRQCGNRMFLFDIGAHYGLFSLIAASRGAKVVAVDPSTMATRMMVKQVALNRAQRKIRVVQAAVSDTAGSVQMLSSGVFSEGYFRLVTGRPPRELTTVPAITIDEMTSEYGAPTHIKIDVEGHEAGVLRGARQTLLRSSPQLFIELHNQLIRDDGRDPGSALDELEFCGYRITSCSGETIDRSQILTESIIRVIANRNKAPAIF